MRESAAIVKILHVSTYVFPDMLAGAERFIRGVATAQAASGHDVTVVSSNQWDLPAEERKDGFRHLRYPVGKVHGLRFYHEVRTQAAAALARLADERFDIVHAHQVTSAVAALQVPWPAGKVMSFHASYRMEYEAEQLDGSPADARRALGLGGRLKSMAIDVLDRRCLRRAERIIVHSQFVLEQVRQLVPAAVERTRIVPAGIDVARFSPGDRERARAHFDLPPGVPCLVTVRRLARRMGIDLLLRAAHLLVQRGENLAVRIGGIGPEAEALAALTRELGLEKHVRFLGRVPDELLRAADVFVLPTRSMEGFGMATVEALASGAPVVATNNGATPEILGAVDPLLLVPAEPEPIAAAIERLLANPELRRKLGQRGVEVVRARYAWPRIVAELDQVYAELCGVPRA